MNPRIDIERTLLHYSRMYKLMNIVIDKFKELEILNKYFLSTKHDGLTIVISKDGMFYQGPITITAPLIGTIPNVAEFELLLNDKRFFTKAEYPWKGAEDGN